MKIVIEFEEKSDRMPFSVEVTESGVRFAFSYAVPCDVTLTNDEMEAINHVRDAMEVA